MSSKHAQYMHLSGVEQLRLARNLINNCSEEFNERFSAEQLLELWRAYRRCDWDFPPDKWTPTQVIQALVGEVPHWSNNEEPIEPDGWIEIYDLSLVDGRRREALETECSLADFLKSNFDSLELCLDVYRLSVGESLDDGGGAQPWVKIRRAR